MVRARGAVEAISTRTPLVPLVVFHVRLGSIASFTVSTDLTMTFRAAKRPTGCELQSRVEIERRPLSKAFHLASDHRFLPFFDCTRRVRPTILSIDAANGGDCCEMGARADPLWRPA